MSRKTKEVAEKPGRRKAVRSAAGKRSKGVEAIDTVATLKELRKATRHTQDDLAHAMGMGQGAISRIEKRDDMLVSTLQHYVEGVGGTLKMLVTFPNRPPLVVERLGKKNAAPAGKPHDKPVNAKGIGYD